MRWRHRQAERQDHAYDLRVALVVRFVAFKALIAPVKGNRRPQQAQLRVHNRGKSPDLTLERYRDACAFLLPPRGTVC